MCRQLARCWTCSLHYRIVTIKGLKYIGTVPTYPLLLYLEFLLFHLLINIRINIHDIASSVLPHVLRCLYTWIIWPVGKQTFGAGTGGKRKERGNTSHMYNTRLNLRTVDCVKGRGSWILVWWCTIHYSPVIVTSGSWMARNVVWQRRQSKRNLVDVQNGEREIFFGKCVAYRHPTHHVRDNMRDGNMKSNKYVSNNTVQMCVIEQSGWK